MTGSVPIAVQYDRFLNVLDQIITVPDHEKKILAMKRFAKYFTASTAGLEHLAKRHAGLTSHQREDLSASATFSAVANEIALLESDKVLASRRELPPKVAIQHVLHGYLTLRYILRLARFHMHDHAHDKSRVPREEHIAEYRTIVRVLLAELETLEEISGLKVYGQPTSLPLESKEVLPALRQAEPEPQSLFAFFRDRHLQAIAAGDLLKRDNTPPQQGPEAVTKWVHQAILILCHHEEESFNQELFGFHSGNQIPLEQKINQLASEIKRLMPSLHLELPALPGVSTHTPLPPLTHSMPHTPLTHNMPHTPHPFLEHIEGHLQGARALPPHTPHMPHTPHNPNYLGAPAAVNPVAVF